MEFNFHGQGVKKNCIGGESSDIDFTIDKKVMFDGLELLNGSYGDTVQLQVLDTDNDDYAKAMGLEEFHPEHVLDQFGTNWNAKSEMIKSLPYKKQLEIGMKIRIKYLNNDQDARMIYVNLDLHRI